jgi:hypothetical protein
MIQLIDQTSGRFGVEATCRVLRPPVRGFLSSRGYRAAKQESSRLATAREGTNWQLSPSRIPRIPETIPASRPWHRNPALEQVARWSRPGELGLLISTAHLPENFPKQAGGRRSKNYENDYAD